MLQAGVGREDITPPVGIAHVNWGARTHDVAEGIHLPLWVTVLVLKDERTQLAIVDFDLGMVSGDDTAMLRELIGAAAGVPPAHVRIAYTHTHAGPPFSGGDFGGDARSPGMDLVPAYRDKVIAAAKAAAKQAAASARPARTAAGYGDSDVTVNRRLALPGGRVVVSQNAGGFADPVVTLVRIDDLDENPIATILGYGTHPIILAHQNRQISPDYPGVAKRVFEKVVGGTCIFLQGCTGDQMPLEGLTGDLGAPVRMGTRLAVDAAQAVLRLRTRPMRARFDQVVESGAPLGLWTEDALPEAAPVLAATSRKFRLPLRRFAAKSVLQAESDALRAELAGLDRTTADPAHLADLNFRAKRAAMNARWAGITEGNTTQEIEMQGFRIGDAALLAVPLEPFAATGVAVREASALPVVQLAGYSNGWMGYVPTAEEFPRGGYEVEWAGPYTEAAAQLLANEAVAAVAELTARN